MKSALNLHDIRKNSDAYSSGLYNFIDLLGSIETNTSLSRINETTISDNNGGRIHL